MELLEVIEFLEQEWHRSFFALPQATFSGSPEISWVDTGHNFAMINAAFASNLRPDRVDKVVPEVLQHFRQSGNAMAWMVGPSSRPGDLGARLLDYGLHQEDPLTCMSLELSQWQPRDTGGQGLEIRQVGNELELKEGVGVFTHSFNFTPQAQDAPFQVYKRLGWDGCRGWTHYGLHRNGRMLAFCSRLAYGRTLAVHNVTVLTSARGQGLATMLVSELLNRSKAEGYDLAVLHATPMGAGIYPKLGFSRQCLLHFYGYRPDANGLSD